MITVNSVGYGFKNYGGMDIHREEGSGDYLFLYIRTDVEIKIHDHFEQIPKNTFFLFEKGVPQYYRKLDGDYINDWLQIDFDNYNHFFERLNIPFQTPMQIQQSSTITILLSEIFAEFLEFGEQHEKILDQMVHTLFYKFSDLYQLSLKEKTGKVSHIHELLAIRKELQTYDYHPKNVKEVAKRINLSTSYLEHIYKEYFGISLGKEIIQTRIDHATHLLNSKEYTITEIAELCSYDNLEHFSRQFKKYKGLSPRKYRNT